MKFTIKNAGVIKEEDWREFIRRSEEKKRGQRH